MCRDSDKGKVEAKRVVELDSITSMFILPFVLTLDRGRLLLKLIGVVLVGIIYIPMG